MFIFRNLQIKESDDLGKLAIIPNQLLHSRARFDMRNSLLLCVGSHFLYFASLFVNADGCKEMTFKDTLQGKALKNHVFKTERATNDGHCESKCFLEDRCIAYSFGRDKDNQTYMCELSESDHVMHPEDLVDRPDTIYRRAENNCQCQKYQVCRVNFVDNTHRCECKPWFTGQQCEIEILPCDSQPCLNSATCVNNANQFNCICKPGFTGKVCETAINHCDPLPCLNGGTCTGDAVGYSCQCLDGFLGKNCQIKYHLDSRTVTWKNADTECKSQETNLPSIHSAEENEIVRQLQVKVHHWMWIGLRLNQSGMYAWSDGSPFDYQNWSSDQSATGGCAYIDYTGKWFQYPCSWNLGIGCILSS